MTERLYQRDSYLKTFTAHVTQSGPEGVVLDRSAFFPAGGGVEGDAGTLRGPDGAIHQVVGTAEGEQGPQARVIRPGFHVEMFPPLNVVNTVEHHPNIVVPDGYVGYLVARDGAALRPDQSFADPLDSFARQDGSGLSISDMLDAETFLKNGGQKGAQTTVLPPGTYALNTYLWDVTIPQRVADRNGNPAFSGGMHQIEIDSGYVGVVTSRVHAAVNFGTLTASRPKDCTAQLQGAESANNLAAALVPVGCIGVWNTPLLPGRYLINSQAYHVDGFETRAQTWEFKGGYKRRYIDLSLDQAGSLTQSQHEQDVPVPPGSADPAITLVVEGWLVPLELRVLAQVTPDNAPFVVASVGGLPEIVGGWEAAWT